MFSFTFFTLYLYSNKTLQLVHLIWDCIQWTRHNYGEDQVLKYELQEKIFHKCSNYNWPCNDLGFLVHTWTAVEHILNDNNNNNENNNNNKNDMHFNEQCFRLATSCISGRAWYTTASNCAKLINNYRRPGNQHNHFTANYTITYTIVQQTNPILQSSQY